MGSKYANTEIMTISQCLLTSHQPRMSPATSAELSIDRYIYHSSKWYILALQSLKLTWIIQSAEKNSMPKLRKVIGRTKTKIFCQRTVCGRYVLSALRTVKFGLSKAGNQAKPLKYSEKKKKSSISYQFRADAQMNGHRPRNTGDNETDVWAQKRQLAAWWLLLPHQYGQ